MAQDHGRQFLEEQIQNSLDFLDDYLENVLSGPKTESVAELLKTPGRKKNAPGRTRAATAAAAKVKAVVTMSLEDNDVEQGDRGPINSFHKALLQAKQTGDEATSVVIPPGPHEIAQEAVPTPPAAAVPDNNVDHDNGMLVDDDTGEDDGAGAVSLGVGAETVAKELSMIAEDDELAERSRMSGQLSLPSALAAPRPTGNSPQSVTTTHIDLDQSAQNDMADVTSASANTFHSIPLDSPPPPARAAPVIALPSETHLTEPLPRPPQVSTSHDDAHSLTAPLPIVPLPASTTHLDELSVPIREGPPASASAPSLARKPSLSQLGLPAPSPLHKSTWAAREPSMGTGLTTGPGVGGKRSSWLVKAREAKAMESMATNRTSSIVSTALGIPGTVGTKRKSGEMLGGPAANTGGAGVILKGVEEEERASKSPKLTDSGEDMSARKGKSKQADVDGHQDAAATTTEPGLPPALAPPSPPQQSPGFFTTQSAEDLQIPLHDSDGGDEVLDRFKRTVEGLGARVGKSMGKSLGGNAAAALAEARAAAEARVAERNKVEGMDESTSSPETKNTSNTAEHATASSVPPVDVSSQVPISTAEVRRSNDAERRLSVSDLVSSSGTKQPQVIAPVVQSLPQASSVPGSSKPTANAANVSTSTTPPNSPPPAKNNFAAPLPPLPVFSKPPTVFVPPPVASGSQPTRVTATAGPNRDFSFKLPSANPFSLPSAMTLGVPASLPSPGSQKERVPLSAQSSKASMFSDAIFDKDGDIPAWMPATQDTDFSIQPSQSQQQGGSQLNDLDDDDDSWHVDDKFTSNHMWTPFGFASADKDDTWSTLPSRSTSQKGGDTGPMMTTQNYTKSSTQTKEIDEIENALASERTHASHVPHGAFDFGTKSPEPQEGDIADEAMEIDSSDAELESDVADIVLAGKSTVSLVQPSVENERTRSHSQQSMASTASSSQSHLGFFGQASKLVSSVLGGSKKGKPEPVKSLQLAAQAAKKQQEEIERKTARLKEMENRRQLAMQRKADEDKARAMEEEKKIRDENEKRKREREEHTDKRPIRSVVKKGDEDNTKKRKVAVETEKKLETKKPPSKDKKDAPSTSRIVKPGINTAPGSAMKIGPPLKSAMKQSGTSATNAESVKLANGADAKPSKTIKTVASSSNLKAAAKGKGKAPSNDEDDDQLPSQAVQTQMANRLKAQMQATQPPTVTSESIELPDINSEYSDSDDEDRPRTFDPPEWAQSPELRQALQQQSTVNPDEIFGRIGPLRMEEIFRTRQSRFRARTSSANWSGTDQLTAEEEREYARRMGFR